MGSSTEEAARVTASLRNGGHTAARRAPWHENRKCTSTDSIFGIRDVRVPPLGQIRANPVHIFIRKYRNRSLSCLWSYQSSRVDEEGVPVDTQRMSIENEGRAGGKLTAYRSNP